MDAERFDGFTRALSQGVTRRTLMPLLGGLALGSPLVSLDLTQAKKKDNDTDKKKKSCPPCKKKKDGKCKANKPNGTACENGGTCQSGSCVPSSRPSDVSPPPPPPPPCQGRANDTPCNGDGRCLNGVCNPRPTCGLSATTTPCTKATQLTDCCSGICFLPSVGSQNGYCLGSLKSQACVTDANCQSGLKCVGYTCQPK